MSATSLGLTANKLPQQPCSGDKSFETIRDEGQMASDLVATNFGLTNTSAAMLFRLQH